MPYHKHGYPRPVILKDGSEVWLRMLDPSQDRQRLLDFYAGLEPRDRWYLWHDVSDLDVVCQCILQYDPRLVLPVVALDDQERIVGKGTLYRHFPGARGHVARVRVVLSPAFRAMRLGTFLMLDLVQLAVDMDLRLLVAEFIRGVEDKAIRAARKLDFFEQAVMPDYAKDPRGNRYDLVMMTKRIHRGFDDF